MLTATSENVIVVAKTLTYPGYNLLAYDIHSGNLSWQKRVDLPLLLTSDQNTLYLGGNNKVALLDSKSGALIDDIPLPGVGVITSFYQMNEKFFARQ